MSEPSWFQSPGPGLLLVGARSRVIRAVLAIQLAQVEGRIGPDGIDRGPDAEARYKELTDAARELVQIDDHFWAVFKEKMAQSPVPPDAVDRM